MTMHHNFLPDFDIAFQPIIDALSGRIFSQDATVRGKHGETAQSLFLSVEPGLLALADATFRKQALRIAGEAGLTTLLNLDVMPSALENSADALQSTLEEAAACGISGDQLLLQFTETEIIVDPVTFAQRSDDLRQAGLRLAIEDFGAGFAGLNLLADFQPEVVKLGSRLVQGIEAHGPLQAIVRGIIRTCDDLGIDIIAKGIETEEEYFWFLDEGITLFQGPLLARPSLGTLTTAFTLPE